MLVGISKYRLEVVKEATRHYDEFRRVNSPADVYSLLKDIGLMDNAEEVLLLLTADTKNCITGVFEVSRGSISSSIVHPREVFKRALVQNATSIIVAHNHPSGDTTPSPEDIKITKRLVEVGKVVGIELLDHMIVGDESYESLKKLGYIV